MADVLLNGLVLNPNIQWADRYVSFGVRQEVRVSLGGRPLISSAPLIGGRPVTLVATEDSGWLDKATVEALRTMAEQSGAAFSFTYGEELVNARVMFRHHESPALDLRPLIGRVIPEEGDFWIGSIKLMLL